jgi:hypothetical protein
MTTERRLDQRIFARWPVEISAVDEAGRQFVERAYSLDVSSLGCRFLIHNSVQAGGVIAVEALGPNGEDLADEFPRLFVVVRMQMRGELREIGVRSLLEDDLSGAAPDVECAKLETSGAPCSAKIAQEKRSEKLVSHL